MDRSEEVRKELEEIGSRLPGPDPVEAPEGYFERMQEDVLQRIRSEERDDSGGRSESISLGGTPPWYQWAAAAVLACLLFVALWKMTPEPGLPVAEASNDHADEWSYLQSYSYELDDAMLYELQAASGKTDLFIAVDFPEESTGKWLEQEGVFEEEIIY